MKTKKFTTNNNRGFIILFAVTLSAIFLSIALGIANVSFKEVSFSTSARDSNDAFLAADTGAECALFYDKLGTNYFPIAGPATPITCGSTTTLPDFTTSGGVALYTFTITGFGSAGNSCAKVEVSKDNNASPVKITVNSTGYNTGDAECSSTNLRRVERELVISSFVGTTPAYIPPPSNVDLKCNGGDSCSVAYGSSALFSWTTSASVTSCTATTNGSWSGTKTWPTGSETISNLISSQSYSITCTGVQGSSQDSVTVNVISAPQIGTGGTITTSGSYTIHTFTGSGTFNPGPDVTNVQALVVAGGGGGATASDRTGGGGGAGGVLYSSSSSVTPSQYYTVTVGNGGAADTSGSNSSFSTLVATGGGRGGRYLNGCISGASGGSGGGKYHNSCGSAGSGTAGQGNSGGIGYDSGVVGSPFSGGGGGGAGGAGANGTSSGGGTGGSGTSNSISGSSVTYAGGGGGGGENVNGGAGGTGGGGAGARSGAGSAGTTNTGGGGGGGGTGGAGGAGGKGIVIIRYLTPTSPISPPSSSQTFIANGSFVVPTFNNLTVQCWGGGGGGGGDLSATLDGGSATASSFGGYLTAGGGGGGENGSTHNLLQVGGAGGTASGGTTNTTGASGQNPQSTRGGAGGSAPSGGAGGGGGGNGNGKVGETPGGGGGGGNNTYGSDGGAGGGSGAFVSQTFTTGQLTVGQSIPVTIGTGGNGGDGTKLGGSGASGECRMWYNW